MNRHSGRNEPAVMEPMPWYGWILTLLGLLVVCGPPIYAMICVFQIVAR